MVKKKSAAAQVPAAGEGKRGLNGYLAYLLRQANASVRLSLDRALDDLGVTLPQFSALTMIASYETLSSADLARLSLLTPQTVNVIVRNLEERKAIRRKQHPVHGRILVLEMTEEGQKLLSRCRVRADKIEARLNKALAGKAEEMAVRRWLVAIGADGERETQE